MSNVFLQALYLQENHREKEKHKTLRRAERRMLTGGIVPENQMWVQANFKETQLGSVRIGQPATVRSDFYGTKQKGSRLNLQHSLK
jgi:multidrug resistance efflux pump